MTNLYQQNLMNLQYVSNNFPIYDIVFDHTEQHTQKSLDYVSNCKILTGTTPIHNNHLPKITAKNTECHVQKGKSRCLIVTGESWSYGDRLVGVDSDQVVVASIQSQDQLSYRLDNIFAGHCARMLDSDLYLSAVPGNSNTGIVFHLPSILNYVKQFNYEEIFVIVQLTSPGRCLGDSRWHLDIPLWNNWISDTLSDKTPHNDFYLNNKISLDQWFDVYEYGITTTVNSFCNRFGVTDLLCWKNFNSVRSIEHNCKIAKQAWVEYLTNLYQHPFDLPTCNEAAWWDEWVDKIYVLEKVTTETKLQELQKLENSNEFIRQVPINNWHPKPVAHYLWAVYLLKQAGWVDEI